MQSLQLNSESVFSLNTRNYEWYWPKTSYAQNNAFDGTFSIKIHDCYNQLTLSMWNITCETKLIYAINVYKVIKTYSVYYFIKCIH